MTILRILLLLLSISFHNSLTAGIYLKDTLEPQSRDHARTLSSAKTVQLLKDGLQFPKKYSLKAKGGAASITGLGERDNPIRYKLSTPRQDREIFFGFLFRYDSSSIDHAKNGDGEFFVFWLDEQEGNDTSTHSTGIPNVGLHVATKGSLSGKNVFMARVGVQNTKFSTVELQGDQTYLIVGRLSKRETDKDAPYSDLQLWINPGIKELSTPDVKVFMPMRVNTVRWVGFSTGRKTERGDRITVDELTLGTTWESVLGLPENSVDSKSAPRPTRTVDFRREVYPILKARCFLCHQGEDPEGGYRLDVRAEILGETNAYPLAIEGHSSKSRIMRRINADDTSRRRMPPKGERLSEHEVEILQRWIDSGLAWDDGLLPSPDLKSDHWAFQPIKRPSLPKTSTHWIRNKVDLFIADQQQRKNTEVSPSASKRVLIRRLYLDLLGLPPDPEAVKRFLEDERPDAYERLVEQLLSSPHHGQRWGRHWLDLARWAESNGHQHNRLRPHAWRYRDYVVDSFNKNKPYDQFLLEQLAGDEKEPFSQEAIIATGFLAAARYSGNELDKNIQRNDMLVDMVNTTASSMLGLTLGCAQCHNHKFDPLTARDYYRFQGFFIQGQPVDLILRDQGQGAMKAAQQMELDDLMRERLEIFSTVRARLVQNERKRRPQGEILILRQTVIKGMNPQERLRYDSIGRRIKALQQTWAFYSPATSSHRMIVNPQLFRLRWPLDYNPTQLCKLKPRLLVRGEINNPGPIVDVGWPALFGPVPEKAKVNLRPRTALARWMTSRENPLTARVWVNRIWHYHFGRGLVTTPNNFGTRGARPTHPALLDWLACELIDSGWNTRHIHRLILHSHAYRQAARRLTANVSLDPKETTYWRWKPRRLEAEAIRDSILAVAGRLDGRLDGPSATNDKSSRRALYLQQKRAGLPRMQTLFDGVEGIESCGHRQVSTVPLQPLYLLNNPSIVEASRHLAKRVQSLAGDNPTQQIKTAFEIVLSRLPESEEQERVLDFLTRSGTAHEEQLRQLCHVLLNLNEFLYVP